MHLTQSQEKDLIIIAQSKAYRPEIALAARNELIVRNNRFVWKMCVNYAKRHGGEADEYLGQATLTYIRCIEIFDLSKGLRLNSYSGPAIENKLNTSVRCEANTIRVPTRSQVCTQKDSPRASVWLKDDARRAMQAPSGLTGAYLVPQRQPSEQDNPKPLKAAIARLLKQVSPPRRDVVQRLLRGETIAEIALANGICKQTAYQRYADALRDLRRLLGVSLS